jgi:hypothetical protein
MYVRTHIIYSIETLFGQKKFKKNWTAVNVACRFGQACHKFGSPALDHTGAAERAYTLYVLIILELRTQDGIT